MDDNIFDNPSGSAISRDFLHNDVAFICASEGFTPSQIIHFVIELPFYIPLPTRHILSMSETDNSICVYGFKVTLQKVTLASAIEHAQQREVRKSVVEMLYIAKDAVDTKAEDFNPTSEFDILLEKLNIFLLAYLVNYKNVEVYRLSRLMLSPVCMCSVYNFVDLSLEGNAIFILHSDIPVEIDMLTEKDIQKIVEFTYVIREELNPFIQQEEMFLSSQRYLKEGFYTEAVTYAQMMIDEFLRSLFVHLLISEGRTSNEADSIRENTPFLSMVKQEFHTRLGGKWQVNIVGTEVSDWYNDTYLLRNRISHGAYFPSYVEAESAVDKAGKLRNYIVSLIQRNKKKYPDIYKFFFAV